MRAPGRRQAAQHVLAQILEMVRLAKERGEIGRDRIAELRELLHIAFEALAILGEAAQLQRAQASRQPTVNELALLVRQMDSRHAISRARAAPGSPPRRRRTPACAGWSPAPSQAVAGSWSEELHAAFAGVEGRSVTVALRIGHQQVEQDAMRLGREARPQVFHQHRPALAPARRPRPRIRWPPPPPADRAPGRAAASAGREIAGIRRISRGRARQAECRRTAPR